MTTVPIPTEMSNGQNDNTKPQIKSSITQRLQTDLVRSVGGNYSHPTGMVNRFTDQTFPLSATAV